MYLSFQYIHSEATFIRPSQELAPTVPSLKRYSDYSSPSTCFTLFAKIIAEKTENVKL